jgi:hypothetical protein
VHRVPIRVVPDLAQARMPTPVVEVSLGTDGEERAFLLVDSGVAIHTLAEPLLVRLHLSTSVAKEQLTDTTETAREVRVAHEVVLPVVGGGELRLHAAVLTPLPPGFERLNVVGIVSPQLLAEAGEAVLYDLRAPSLSVGPLDALLRESGATAVDAANVKVCADEIGDGKGGKVTVRVYGLRASVGGKDAWMLHDTGAAISKVHEGSAAAAGLRPEGGATERGALGKPAGVPMAKAVPISFLGQARTLDVKIGPMPGGCVQDGLLGLDALSRCATVLGPDKVWMRCD